jgi:hypothetical protein
VYLSSIHFYVLFSEDSLYFPTGNSWNQLGVQRCQCISPRVRTLPVTFSIEHPVTALPTSVPWLWTRQIASERLVPLYRPTVQYVTFHSDKLFLTSRSRLYPNGWYPCTVPHYVTLHYNELFLTPRSSLTQALTFPTCIPKSPVRMPPTNRPC